MATERGAVQGDLQAAAARIRAMTPAEVDAASPAEVQRMLETVLAARREVEAESAAAERAAADRRRLLQELDLSMDAEFVAGARAAALAGAASTRRSAAEYKGWSDERIARMRLDPEVQLADEVGIPFDDLPFVSIPARVEGLNEDGLDFDEPSPLFTAFERLVTAQQAANQADAGRVRAALTAWRTADALAPGPRTR